MFLLSNTYVPSNIFPFRKNPAPFKPQLKAACTAVSFKYEATKSDEPQASMVFKFPSQKICNMDPSLLVYHLFYMKKKVLK